MDKIKHSVLIPVVNVSLANELLYTISKNTIIPEEILIIDNTGLPEEYHYKCRRLNIEVYKPDIPWTLNTSWKNGFKHISDCKYVNVFNDDILLNKHYFERTERVLTQKEKVAVSVPKIVKEVSDLQDIPIKRKNIQRHKRVLGCAFTIRKEILDIVPEIPDNILTTFYGDNWLFYFTFGRGLFVWHCDVYNLVWHKVGATLHNSKYLKYRKIRPFEERMYRKFIADNGDRLITSMKRKMEKWES